MSLTIHLLEFTALADRRAVSRLLLCHVLGAPVTATRLGRPLAAGERADTAAASVAHDSGVLVVAHHPGGCGVDVEDTDPALLAEVTPRFCGPTEVVAEPRAAWAVKESVAKSLGLGLAAGLRTITTAGDPRTAWVPALRHGRPLGRLVRVVTTGRRDLAVTVVAAAAPAVTVRCWTALDGRLAPAPVAGRVVAAALLLGDGQLGDGRTGHVDAA